MTAKVAYDYDINPLDRPALGCGIFHIRTLEQAKTLTNILSSACPDPDRAAFALFELLANAIEHGNLEISGAEKQHLIEKNQYGTEIRRRLALPDYKDRYVVVTAGRDSDQIWFMIEDQGPGFDHKAYAQVDLSANQTCSGRGIALVRATGFDSLTYLDRGNKILATLKCAAG